MGIDTLEKILGLLKSKNIFFEHLKHEHVHTSHDAAKIRGNSLEQAAKAIVLKVKPKKGDYFFIQCVLPGNKKIDLKKLKSSLSLKSASLASADDVLNITGCSIGSVPPFGFLFGLKVYADKSVFLQKEIFFSSGTHNDSIRMKSEDYLTIVVPDLLDFAE